MNIHFLVYCETLEFYWYECDYIPRIGDKIITPEGDFKVMEVCWKSTNNYSRSVQITLDRL